jgi:hypothetical protein
MRGESGMAVACVADRLIGVVIPAHLAFAMPATVPSLPEAQRLSRRWVPRRIRRGLGERARTVVLHQQPEDTVPPTPSATSSHRRIYVRTSNGDWMDMTPQPGVERPEVAVFAVQVSDLDELWDVADQGAGEFLGRLVIADGRPVLE